jgi:hypothetical protein
MTKAITVRDRRRFAQAARRRALSWLEAVSEREGTAACGNRPFLLPASCAAGESSSVVVRVRLTTQGSVIVPEALMIASAAVLMRPLPLPVAFVNLPVPPTMVCAISRNSGVFFPAT